MGPSHPPAHEVTWCFRAKIVCQNLYSPSLTGAPQLSGEDVRETVGLLSPYRRDPRLMEALEKLRDDLLEDSAWPVIMQHLVQGRRR